MPAVTVIFPDDMLARIDAIVTQRKVEASKPRQSQLTPLQRQEAVLIAEKHGVNKANEYLRSLRTPVRRPSRMGLVLEFVEHRLAEMELEELKAAEQKPTPQLAKTKGRR